MGNETIAALRQNWPAILGWAIFIALMVALLAGHYVFNPFTFGFAYYVGFVISQAAKSKENQDVRRLTDNFQLEVNYAYPTDAGNRSEYLIVDVVEFSQLNAFLQTLEADVKAAEVMSLRT